MGVQLYSLLCSQNHELRSVFLSIVILPSSNHYTDKKSVANGDEITERSIDVQFSPWECAGIIEALRKMASDNPDTDFGL